MRIVRRITRDTTQAVRDTLLQHLHLDPTQVTADGITATYHGGNAPVILTWQGTATLTVEEFNQLLDGADQTAQTEAATVEAQQAEAIQADEAAATPATLPDLPATAYPDNAVDLPPADDEA